MFANEIKESSTLATVVKIIDGDTIQVVLPNDKKTYYVKLKGINSKSFDESFSYITNELLGKTVTLVKDSDSYNGSKFNYMIIYYKGKNINQYMLENGYAVIDNSQNNSSFRNTFLNSQAIASDNLYGMWKYNSKDYSSINGINDTNINAIRDKINMNTVTKEQMIQFLNNVNENLAENIIKYRKYNPFSSISELKFVKGFTNEIYKRNKNIMTVYTNINTATSFELKTLDDISDSYIDKIIEKREFSSVKELLNIMSSSEFNKIKNFITTGDISYLDVSVERYRANISVSKKEYLRDVGISYYDADQIIENRKNGYTFKTLMELTKLDNNKLDEYDIHQLEDNLNTIIDLNTDNEQELIGILGSSMGRDAYNKHFSNISDLKNITGTSIYEKVEKILYLDGKKPEYININTASKKEMESAKIYDDDIYKIIKNRPITSSKYLPCNVSYVDDKISLYTNINTASKKELLSLNNGISNNIVDKIINYRKNNNFGSLDEIYTFFKQNNATNIYNKIKHYIVTR